MSDICTNINLFSDSGIQTDLLVTLLGFITIEGAWWKDMFVYPICTYGWVGAIGSSSFGIGQIHGGAYILRHWNRILYDTICKYFNMNKLAPTRQPALIVDLIRTDRSQFFSRMNDKTALWKSIDFFFLIVFLAQGAIIILMIVVTRLCDPMNVILNLGVWLLLASNVISYILLRKAGGIRYKISSDLFYIVYTPSEDDKEIYSDKWTVVIDKTYELDSVHNIDKYGEELLKKLEDSCNSSDYKEYVHVGIAMISSGISNLISTTLILLVSRYTIGPFISLLMAILMILQIIGQKINAGIWNPNSLK